MLLYLDDAAEPPNLEWGSLQQPERLHLLIGASRRGRSHEALNSEREDAFALAMSGPGCTRAWYALAVADGVGSAQRARDGARVCVRAAIESLRHGLTGAEADDVLKLIEVAVEETRLSVARASVELSCPVDELASTLLVAAALEDDNGLTFAAFQAGDGLVAAYGPGRDRLLTLLEPGDQDVDGAIRPFHSPEVFATMDKRRLKSWHSEEIEGLLLMSDGVANDLIPLSQGGPMLIRELAQLGGATAGQGLVDLLAYKKRGSMDDRTLVGLFRNKPCDPEALAARSAPDPVDPAQGAQP